MPTDKSLAKGTRAALSFAGAFIGLTGLFVTTMYRQFGAIDWSYLWFALIRIVAISVGVAAVMYFSSFGNRRTAAIFGCMLGFAGALAYYFLVVAST